MMSDVKVRDEEYRHYVRKKKNTFYNIEKEEFLLFLCAIIVSHKSDGAQIC